MNFIAKMWIFKEIVVPVVIIAGALIYYVYLSLKCK